MYSTYDWDRWFCASWATMSPVYTVKAGGLLASSPVSGAMDCSSAKPRS